MDGIATYVVPRVLHVLGVVLWIGGVGLVATVVLPALRRWDDPAGAYRLFQEFARRFIWQARITTLVVGVSGLHLLSVLGAWNRFLSPDFWWMWAMFLLWLFFTVVLFVLQPLAQRRGADRELPDDPRAALGGAQRMHWILLGLSLATVAGAVAGAHGWSWI